MKNRVKVLILDETDVEKSIYLGDGIEVAVGTVFADVSLEADEFAKLEELNATTVERKFGEWLDELVGKIPA